MQKSMTSEAAVANIRRMNNKIRLSKKKTKHNKTLLAISHRLQTTRQVRRHRTATM